MKGLKDGEEGSGASPPEKQASPGERKLYYPETSLVN